MALKCVTGPSCAVSHAKNKIKKHFTTKHVSWKPATTQKQLLTLPIQITSKMPAIVSPAKKTLNKTPQTEIQIFVMHETLIIQQLHKNNIRKCNFQFQHSLITVIRYHDDIKNNSKTDHLNWTELNGKTGVNSVCMWVYASRINSPAVMQDPRGKLARCA